ncbi:MAG: TrmH family RNA methyltransferase [Bacteroidota bacterium]
MKSVNDGSRLSSFKTRPVFRLSLSLTMFVVFTPASLIPHSSFPLALIIGNEITGVSKPLLDLSDLAIEVPMYGIKPAKGRLNVAVAYGVALFELVRIYHSLRASP